MDTVEGVTLALDKSVTRSFPLITHPPMTAQRPSPVGTCPSCGTEIGDRHILIQYATATGPGIYAECPGCRDVISPT